MNRAEIERRLNTSARLGPKKVKSRKAAFTILSHMEEHKGRADLADIERAASRCCDLVRESTRRVLYELKSLGLVQKTGTFEWALVNGKAPAAKIDTMEDALAEIERLRAQIAAAPEHPGSEPPAPVQREYENPCPKKCGVDYCIKPEHWEGYE